MRGAKVGFGRAAVLVSAVAALSCRSQPIRQGPAPQMPERQKIESARYPPAVLTGDGVLLCDISAKKNGHQKLDIVAGGGLEFNAVVSPIVDGTVTARGPAQGGRYQFTSHLANPAKAKLPGVGEIDLDELETKVQVEMARYQQPGGRGTALSFNSGDMNQRGIYVEFAGRGHAANGESYSFRVNLGAPTDGSGRVDPANDNVTSSIMSKMVNIRAPVTTVLVTTTVNRAP